MTEHDDTSKTVPLEWVPGPIEDVIAKTAEFVGTVPGVRTFTFGWDAVDRELEDDEEPDPSEPVRWWVKATARRKLARGHRPVEQSWIRYAVYDPAQPFPIQSHEHAVIVAGLALLDAMGADRLLLDRLTNPTAPQE